MKFNRSLMGVALLGATVFSANAMAGLSGNVGVFSDYMFRGVSQTAGAAVQGGIDWSSGSGLYAGTWVSNLAFAGDGSYASGGAGTEQDIYVGYAGSVGDLGYDFGALYYLYTEDDAFSTLEIYGKLSYSVATLAYYYSSENEFFLGDGNAEASGYLNGAVTLPISDSLNFVASLGLFSGDEIKRVLAGDSSYFDYNIGLSKSLDGGLSATFQYIGTDIDGDNPKFVLGLKKSFDL